MRQVIFLCLILTACLITTTHAQLEGSYTGNYRIIQDYGSTSSTTTDYPVEIIFTSTNYQFIETVQGLCVPSGSYSVQGSLEFVQQDAGCITLNGDPVNNPEGTFNYYRTQDSLICTQIASGTIKTFYLKRSDIQYKLELSPAVIGALPSATSVELPIYLINTEDTVIGFQIWLQFSRPDIAAFQETFDTNGTLISGWDLVDASMLGGIPYNLLLTGIADLPNPPEIVPGFTPQNGTEPLIKVYLDVYDVPDTMTDRIADIYVNQYFLDHFTFTDPSANTIGLATDTVPDTTYFVCDVYGDPPLDTICLSWSIVPGPPADSISVEDKTFNYLDTSLVHVRYGAIRAAYCGNVDAYDSQVDISDLLFLVDYMFTTGTGIQPVYYYAADMDGSGTVDISDLLYLVDYMFLNPPGPAPVCQ